MTLKRASQSDFLGRRASLDRPALREPVFDAVSALTFDALINRTGCHKTDDVERNAAVRSSPCLDDLGGPG